MPATVARRRRDQLLGRLQIVPLAAGVRETLDRALTEAERRSPGRVTVLDAGCGHKSPLRPFRSRIQRMVGVDVHAPDVPLPYLDEFAIVDLCKGDGWPFDGAFDVALSNFTMEHLVDPAAALVNLRQALRPGGTLVLTTVNRRHPFVAAYLGMPDRVRRRLQPVLKASAADAHPLVGRCNDPAALESALIGAGFEAIRLRTYGNLARAWGRHLPTFALGLAGDMLTRGLPGARSTILAVARRPALPDPLPSR